MLNLNLSPDVLKLMWRSHLEQVLHAVGGDKAACAVITLDTPGANYRTVWALQKTFPGLKTFVRAHDIEHGLNLEKAGATAVVPETLEPSLQVREYISPRQQHHTSRARLHGSAMVLLG